MIETKFEKNNTQSLQNQVIYLKQKNEELKAMQKLKIKDFEEENKVNKFFHLFSLIYINNNI